MQLNSKQVSAGSPLPLAPGGGGGRNEPLGGHHTTNALKFEMNVFA